MKLTCLALIRGYINIRPHTKTTCRQTMAFSLYHSALPSVPYVGIGDLNNIKYQIIYLGISK